MKKLIIATGLLMATSAYAQTEVLTGVTRGKDYGVVYSLPKTQIELEIKANKVNYTPGEFSKYADRYLRLTNVSTEPEEYWELASVKVKSVGVPNSETTYFVKLKDKTVAPLMELTEDGIVKTINVPYSKSSSDKKTAPAPTVLSKIANPREFLTEEILPALPRRWLNWWLKRSITSAKARMPYCADKLTICLQTEHSLKLCLII